MHYTPAQLDRLLDLVIEAVLRELETERDKNAEESVQEQYRRKEGGTICHARFRSAVDGRTP
jgi:hypothetical protein